MIKNESGVASQLEEGLQPAGRPSTHRSQDSALRILGHAVMAEVSASPKKTGFIFVP